MFQNLSTRLSKWRAVAATCLLAGAASVAHAGFYTDNEVGMDAIFAQAGIDIRFNAVQTIHNSGLLILNGSGGSDTDLNAMDLIVGAGPTVGMFFIDSIAYCGGPTTTTVGCAFINNNVMALDSSWAGGLHGPYGAKLASHELGHALGLDHDGDANNVMNGTINATTNALLDSTQITKILTSGLVQTDGRGQRFIDIQPYVVLADLVNTVPEPGTLLLAALALGAAAASRRKAQ